MSWFAVELIIECSTELFSRIRKKSEDNLQKISMSTLTSVKMSLDSLLNNREPT
jgi:hypothetical protein